MSEYQVSHDTFPENSFSFEIRENWKKFLIVKRRYCFELKRFGSNELGVKLQIFHKWIGNILNWICRAVASVRRLLPAVIEMTFLHLNFEKIKNKKKFVFVSIEMILMFQPERPAASVT